MSWDSFDNGLSQPTREQQTRYPDSPRDAERYERSRKRLGLALASALVALTVWLVVAAVLDGRTRALEAWPIDPSEGADQGSPVRTIYFVEGCGDTVRVVELEETATSVKVKLEGKGISENDCQRFVRVRLRDGLGDREIVDLVSGRRFRADPSTGTGYRVVND